MRDAESDYLDFEPGETLDQLIGASIRYRIAIGPNAGRKALTLRTVPAQPEPFASTLLARQPGFSLHAATCCEANQRDKLEKLCRYITRPAIANERLSTNERGQVVYRFKQPFRDGTTHVVLDPLDFIARLAALVPRPRLNLTRFHGVFAPNCKLREHIVPRHQPTAKAPDKPLAPMTWMQRLKRVYSIDIETCPKCGGKLRVIACIEDPDIIARILEHIRTRDESQPSQPRAPPPRTELPTSRPQYTRTGSFDPNRPLDGNLRSRLQNRFQFRPHRPSTTRARGTAQTQLNSNRFSLAILADLDEKRVCSSYAPTARRDVTDPESIRSAAQATIDRFGKVHLLANNAGVYLEGGAGEISLEKWRWVIDVNLMSVICGVETFLPLIRAHGEGGHILNTASVAGFVGFAGIASYIATKHAVVGYSESLAWQLESEGIGVSILCPGFVATRIADIERHGREGESNNPNVAVAVSQGMSPVTVAKYALEQVQSGALHILAHPGSRDVILERYCSLTKALEMAAGNDIIMSDPDSRRVASRDHIGNM